MDIKAVGEKIGKLIKKYRVAILILVLGIVLMILIGMIPWISISIN